jgi:tetratricopeptide (TPR) repeat protein
MTTAYSIKRLIHVILLLFSTGFAVAANDFTDELQWLAAQIACIGQYNNAQAGDYTHGDPPDYYKPNDIREYLTRQSGDRTRTETFYGICFDYAQAAYNSIKNNKSYYESLGMKKGGWYIVATNVNPNLITLYDPVSRDKATLTMNGVYVKEYTRLNIQAHGNAPNHAWLWVYGKDGTIYWIDPTWTDNTGYVWWGIVQGEKEVQRISSQDYCMVAVNQIDEAFAYFNRGNEYLNKERYDQAIADFTQVIRIDPNYADAYNQRGSAYINKGDADRAIADFNQVIRLEPNNALAYLWRGVSYQDKYLSQGYKREDLDRAFADRDRAFQLDPNSVTIQKYIKYFGK